MKLEILSALPNQEAKPHPVLFVHGSFVDASCWAEYFLDYFAAQGYAAYAVSLRGHGNSEGYERLMEASLTDYMADVLQVAETFAHPPILIGHSMGGMVVQHYLAAQHTSAAVVLMNSVPPSGLWDSAFYMAFTDPLALQQLTLMQNVSMQFAAPNAMKRILFSTEIPEDKLQKYMTHVQPESQRAVLDMLGLELPHFKQKPAQPILVLGAQDDAFLPSITIEATARFYGTVAKLYPRMGHAMMLETHWQQVADDIVQWLDAQISASAATEPVAEPIASAEAPQSVESTAAEVTIAATESAESIESTPTEQQSAKKTTRAGRNALRKTPTKGDTKPKTSSGNGRRRRKKVEDDGDASGAE